MKSFKVSRYNGRLSIEDGNHRTYWAQNYTRYDTIAAWVVDHDMQKDIDSKQGE